MTTEEKKSGKKKNVTKFRIYCLENGITQHEIKEKTKLSIGCIHGMWNDGKANDSSIRLVSLAFDIPEEKLKKMING